MFLMNNYKTAILLVIGLVIVVEWISTTAAIDVKPVPRKRAEANKQLTSNLVLMTLELE